MPNPARRPARKTGAPVSRRTGGQTSRSGSSAKRSRDRRDGGDKGQLRSGTSAGLGGDQVEGRQAVRELLRARRRPVYQVMIADGLDDSDALSEILTLASDLGVPIRRVGRGQLDATALTDAPQGVVASAEPISERELGDLLQVAGPSRPFLVVLDGVTDPHNLGAVMRSALCAGATGLVIGRHRAARLSPSAVKAAAGAVEHLPIATVAGIPAALAQMTEAGVWTVGLDSEARTPLWDMQMATEPLAIVLGAEGRGLSRLSRLRCELVVNIPLAGPLESLNVSAAAALACFEVARRRSA